MSPHSVFLFAGILTIAATLISLRSEHIRTEHSVSWLLVGVVITGLALFPAAPDNLAKRFGLDPMLLFALIAGALISILVFEISHVVSRLRDENTMLAQRIAILEFHLREKLEQERDQNKDRRIST